MSGRIMIVTGEASGDIYGALLAREMKRLDAGVDLCGVGGESMRAAGVEILLDSAEISVVGIWEALVKLGSLRKASNLIKDYIRRQRPDLVVLIDYPGMNLRLARYAKRAGIRVMYYVSPQVWAWGRNRIGMVRRYVDKMVVILPFEAEVYRRAGVDATYVGHPLLDIVRAELTREAFLARVGLDPSRRLVALLPGSRHQEIKQHIGPLLETAALLRRRYPDLDFVVVTLPACEELVRSEIARSGERMLVTAELRYEAIAHSQLAVVCSGTVTLEAALLGTPMIVMYRLALFSWVLGRMIVRVPYISLVNLVAREEIVPELIQAAAKPRLLAEEAMRILDDEPRRRAIVERLGQVKVQLGPGGATRKAAGIALSMVSGPS
jgi:lipid-A-disaccharide synthase